jgi:ribonuclease VapC
MVIDTSALIAILSMEPEAEQFAVAIQEDPVRLVSVATFLESAIVIESRYGLPGGEKLNQLISTGSMKLEVVTYEQMTIARTAYQIYGKGRHPAGLNFGDCFAYALAKITGEPLLFKGNDFNQTDILRVSA